MNEKPDFTGTNFEAIKPKQAQELVDVLPEYQSEESISEISEHKLGTTDLTDFQADEGDDVDQEATPPALIENADECFDDDFNKARNNIKELEQRRDDILNELFAVAKASQAPRAFEVLADMIDKFASLGDRTMELHLKREKIKVTKTIVGGGSGGGGNGQSGTATIRLTTKDLLDMIRGEESDQRKQEQLVVDGDCKVIGDDNA